MTTPNQESWQLTGLEIATRWAELPPEHLRAALRMLESQLAREHEYKKAILEAETQQAKNRQTYMLHMTGLYVGVALALAMLAAAVALGINGQPWLATLMTGPSLIALIKIVILRQSNDDDMRAVRQQVSAQVPAPPAAPEPGQSPLV